jgi:hypothetical protein
MTSVKMDTELPNLFIWLYRHRPQRHSTPKENFVTEAFAIVLSMQRKLLSDFFHRFGEEDIPNDVQVETQVLTNGSCFDITVSNNKDFFFLIECKLDAGFGSTEEDESDQLWRYAEEVRCSSARRKGLITLTARTPPDRDFGDIRLLTARWTDVLKLCDAQPIGMQDMAVALTSQFAELLRFLKVDRGVHSNGRRFWRCDLCSLETSGQGIYSHKEKHCREYAYLIDRDNERLRDDFKKKLKPYLQSVAIFNQSTRSIKKIEMTNYSDSSKVIALLEQAEVPRNLWLHATSQLQCMFSNRAYTEFKSELATLAGVEQLTEPRYVSKTYETILAAVERNRGSVQPIAQLSRRC